MIILFKNRDYFSSLKFTITIIITDNTFENDVFKKKFINVNKILFI